MQSKDFADGNECVNKLEPHNVLEDAPKALNFPLVVNDELRGRNVVPRRGPFAKGNLHVHGLVLKAKLAVKQKRVVVGRRSALHAVIDPVATTNILGSAHAASLLLLLPHMHLKLVGKPAQAPGARQPGCASANNKHPARLQRRFNRRTATSWHPRLRSRHKKKKLEKNGKVKTGRRCSHNPKNNTKRAFEVEQRKKKKSGAVKASCVKEADTRMNDYIHSCHIRYLQLHLLLASPTQKDCAWFQASIERNREGCNKLLVLRFPARHTKVCISRTGKCGGTNRCHNNQKKKKKKKNHTHTSKSMEGDSGSVVVGKPEGIPPGWNAQQDERKINVYMTRGEPLIWTPEGETHVFLCTCVCVCVCARVCVCVCTCLSARTCVYMCDCSTLVPTT